MFKGTNAKVHIELIENKGVLRREFDIEKYKEILKHFLATKNVLDYRLNSYLDKIDKKILTIIYED